MKTKKSREYTEAEVQEKFLRHIWGLIRYWERHNVAEGTHDRLSGLAHSILSTMDGSNLNLPAFIVAPMPHKEDKAYLKACGENWFPENPRSPKTGVATKVKCDIAGNLAYQLYRVKEKMEKESLT